MKLTRKKGNITLFALGYILLFTALAAVIINVTFTWETFSRARMSVEEVAKVRAQAIDIPLKEQVGVIEVLHDTSTSYPNHELKSGMTHTTIVTAPGHRLIRNPDETEYQFAADEADKAAIANGKIYLEKQLTKNGQGEDVLNSVEFCIDIKPLPATRQNITFSCNTPSGFTIQKILPVSSLDDNKYVVMSEGGIDVTQEVKNVVFVGAKFQYRYFIDQIMENFGLPQTRQNIVTSIAYPQVDKCYSETCTP